MKVFLMYRDRDFNVEAKMPPNWKDLKQDLELNTLFEAMARGDKFLFDIAEKAISSSLTNPETIRYRQHVLTDCLEHPAVGREIYEVATETIVSEKKIWRFFFRSPQSTLSGAVSALELFVESLKKLRQISADYTGKFRSEGFVRFFSMITQELDDEYFRVVQEHLRRLRFQNGILMSAKLGRGNKGADYVLLRQLNEQPGRIKRIFAKGRLFYSFEIADRDEGGFQVLSELRDRGLNLVANALAQSTDHILSFIKMLRIELAFYIGCLNLYEKLARKGEPTCTPSALASNTHNLSVEGLYDVCLSLAQDRRVVGNSLSANNKDLVMITGANQGGKSTFLRSVGMAFLMMQSGMFAPAERFSASVCSGIFTHYKREEDSTMKSGKLDEELRRMSVIVDEIGPGSILLCNESFASTNESEGSEIARQAIKAFLESGIRVFFVSHLFELAQRLYKQKTDTFLFLRAERLPDGRRTFRIIEGEPLSTSYGEDLYYQIFQKTDQATITVALACRS
jgi:hypothetical protein